MSIFVKLGLLIALVFGFIASFGIVKTVDNDDIKSYTQTMQFEDNSVYFILRGSDTKLGGFAKQYNKTNLHATHVAMGIFKDSMHIFHANTAKENGQHILTDNMQDFITREKDEYTYLAFWKINTISPQQIDRALAEISHLKTKEIQFDYKFNFESDDKLYCSEFIYKVLNKATDNAFKLPMSVIVVPEEHRFYMKKDTLVCYPSDFFLDYDNISFVSQWINNDSTQ